MTEKKNNGPTGWVREMVVKERDRVILAGGDPQADLIADVVAKEIRKLESGSDAVASALAKAAIDTAIRYYIVHTAGSLCRQKKVEAAIAHNGQVVRHRVPERLSFPRLDQSGAAEAGAGQYRLWVDVPRDEYFAKLAADELSHERDARSIAVRQKGADLLKAYPSADTLRKACSLAGLSVDEFLVS